MSSALCLGFLLVTGAAEKPRLVVRDLTAQAGVDAQVAAALTEAITAEVGARGVFQALSSREVQTLLGAERQRQLLGCTEEGSCLTELAGAIGARFVLSGAVSRLGDAYQLTLQTLDTQKAAPIGRSVRLTQDVTALRAQLPFAVAEATGTPLPPQPSHVLPNALLIAGSAVVLSGGVVGLHALSQESLLQSDIDQTTSGPPKGLAYYQAQRSQYGLERTVSLIGMLGGAALVGAGLYLNPDLHLGRTAVSLAPAERGVALVGRF